MSRERRVLQECAPKAKQLQPDCECGGHFEKVSDSFDNMSGEFVKTFYTKCTKCKADGPRYTFFKDGRTRVWVYSDEKQFAKLPSKPWPGEGLQSKLPDGTKRFATAPSLVITLIGSALAGLGFLIGFFGVTVNADRVLTEFDQPKASLVIAIRFFIPLLPGVMLLIVGDVCRRFGK